MNGVPPAMQKGRLQRSLKTGKGIAGLVLLIVSVIKPIRLGLELISDAQIAREIFPSVLYAFSRVGSILSHPLFPLFSSIVGIGLILWSLQETEVPRNGQPFPTGNSMDISAIEASHPERIFISASLSPSDLRSLCKDKTSADAHRAMQPYIGKWMRVSGQINNILPPASYGQMILFREGYLVDVAMIFDNTWKERISILRKGQAITVIGKIEEINVMDLRMGNCELISV